MISVETLKSVADQLEVTESRITSGDKSWVNTWRKEEARFRYFPRECCRNNDEIFYDMPSKTDFPSG
ncbi:hypothetical protein RRG08_054663 [Elysia crispata]|uniref:Uncharacterized protein n=1 Tax=Elysia crispata TaxID=231223 RepID=A0AAE1B329_9GAST|nr:hypothetical protein RRG08_054663 [Elysia crispata]